MNSILSIQFMNSINWFTAAPKWWCAMMFGQQTTFFPFSVRSSHIAALIQWNPPLNERWCSSNFSTAAFKPQTTWTSYGFILKFICFATFCSKKRERESETYPSIDCCCSLNPPDFECALQGLHALHGLHALRKPLLNPNDLMSVAFDLLRFKIAFLFLLLLLFQNW